MSSRSLSSSAWLIRTIVLAVTLLGGWGIGRTLRVVSQGEANGGFAASAAQGAADATRASTAPPQDTSATLEVFRRLHMALGIQEPSKRERALASLADDLDATQIREALERLAASRIPFRKEAMAQLFARWGEIDPTAAIEFALNLRKLSDRSAAVGAILDGWMEHDPAAAEKWVNTLPNGPIKNAAWKAVIAGYAVIDRSRAIALAEQQSSEWSSSSFAEAIFGSWAMDDPQSAAARASQLSEGAFRREALNIVAMQWAETDPKRAIDWSVSLPDYLVPGELGFGGWLIMTGADRTNTAEKILSLWLQRDSDSAVQWLSELSDDPWKRIMIAKACSNNVETVRDARTAVELANLLPKGGIRDQMLIGAADRISVFEPNTAIEMLTHESDPHSRLMIVRGLADTLKGDNLIAALSQVDSSNAPPGTFWRWSDAETAARWAAQQPGANAYLSGSATVWMKNDPEQAEPFVRALSPPQRDGVVVQMIQDSLYRSRSPQESIAYFEKMSRWIPEIVDADAKQTTYRKLARRWLEVDAESGRRWIDSIPISAQVRSDLLKKVSNTK